MIKWLNDQIKAKGEKKFVDFIYYILMGVQKEITSNFAIQI